jgi:hypothetical protein
VAGFEPASAQRLPLAWNLRLPGGARSLLACGVFGHWTTPVLNVGREARLEGRRCLWGCAWQSPQGSNLQPSGLEPDALPVELGDHVRREWVGWNGFRLYRQLFRARA